MDRGIGRTGRERREGLRELVKVADTLMSFFRLRPEVLGFLGDQGRDFGRTEPVLRLGLLPGNGDSPGFGQQDIHKLLPTR